MNYIDILLKLNKLKIILFAIFLVFLGFGHYLQKIILNIMNFILISIFHQVVF